MTRVPDVTDLTALAYKAGMAVRMVHENRNKPGALGLTWKEDFSPLTAADNAVHTTVIEYMSNIYPHIPVVGEEGQLGTRKGDPDEYWLLVDEVDGTWAFMLGIPLFTIMFTLMRGGQPVVSVIYDPIGNKVYTAELGKGAYRNGERIHVAATLPRIPTVGYVSWPHQNLPSDMLVPGMVDKVVVGLHQKGCIPVNLATGGYFDAHVASGAMHATVFPGRTLHDTAPGHLLIQEAGGRVTDLVGNPLDYNGQYVFGHIFSLGGKFHEELIALVKTGL